MKKNILKEEVTEMKNLINKLLNRDEPEKKAPLSQEDRRNMRDNEDRYHMAKGLSNIYRGYLNNPNIIDNKEKIGYMLKLHLDLSWDTLPREKQEKILDTIIKNKEEGRKVIDNFVNKYDNIVDLKNNIDELTQELVYNFSPVLSQESKYY